MFLLLHQQLLLLLLLLLLFTLLNNTLPAPDSLFHMYGTVNRFLEKSLLRNVGTTNPWHSITHKKTWNAQQHCWKNLNYHNLFVCYYYYYFNICGRPQKCRLWGRYVTFLAHFVKLSHGHHVCNCRPTNISYVASSMTVIYLHSKCHTFTSYDSLSMSNWKRTKKQTQGRPTVTYAFYKNTTFTRLA